MLRLQKGRLQKGRLEKVAGMRGRAGRISGLLGASALGLAGALWTPALWAEDAPPPRLSFDLTSRLSHASNPDLAVSGGTARDQAALHFGLTFASVTRDDDLRLSLGGNLTSGDGVNDPTLTLTYSHLGPNAKVSAQASFTDNPVDLFEPQAGPDGGLSFSDLVAVTGRVQTTNASLALQTGLQGPLGFDLAAKSFARNYSQTSDPSVYDSTSESLSLGATLRNVMGGDVAISLGLTRSDYDDAAQTARDSRSLSLSYSRALDGATSLQVSLGTTRAETRKSGVLAASSTGLTGAFGITRDMGNGAAGLNLALTRDAKGGRQSVQVSRSLDLATGSFSAELGYGARSGGTGDITGKLAWAQTLPSDSLSLSLSRQVTVNEAEADTAQTAASASWDHALGDTSRLGLSLSLSAVSGAGGDTVDGVTRQNLTASYSHDLARDWALTTGITLRRLDRDSTGLAEDQAVFVTIGRKFVLLP